MNVIVIGERVYEVCGVEVFERVGAHDDDVKTCAPALAAAVRCALDWRTIAERRIEKPETP